MPDSRSGVATELGSGENDGERQHDGRQRVAVGRSCCQRIAVRRSGWRLEESWKHGVSLRRHRVGQRCRNRAAYIYGRVGLCSRGRNVDGHTTFLNCFGDGLLHSARLLLETK